MLRAIFSFQKPAFVLGTTYLVQPLWPCQKQPLMKMTARYLGRTRSGEPVDTGFLEGLADEVVKFASAEEGEDGVSCPALVAVQYLNGGGREVHLDYARTFFLCLAGDVLYGDAVVGGDDVIGSEGEEVADAAADVALEDENVAGGLEFFVIAHIRLVQQVALFGGEVVGGAVFLGADGVFAEGIVLRVSHIHTPAPIGTDGAHITDDGVVAAFAGCTFVLGVFPDVFVFLDGFQAGAILQLDRLKERVLSAKEVLQGEECVRVRFIKDDFLAGVQFEAVDDAEDGSVGVDSFAGEFLVPEEFLRLVLKA